MLRQAAQATISYLKLPQGNSCFPDAALPQLSLLARTFQPSAIYPLLIPWLLLLKFLVHHLENLASHVLIRF